MDDLLTHAQKEFAQNPVEVIGAALSILVITLSTLSKAGRGFWAMLWARVRSAPGEKGPTSFQVASPVMTQNFNPTFNPIINIHPAVTATPPAPPTIQAAASVAPQQQTDWTLYDRRRKIFEDIQEFIAYVLRNNGDFELAGPGEYRDFRRNMDVAEDLYGTPDVRAVLKAFDENVREFWASAQTRKRAIETGDIKAINRNHELLSGIISFGERIPEVFKSHLAAGGNTGKSAESPRMALRPTGKYPTVVQGWSYFSISVCNEDKRYGESLYGVRGYLSFTSPRGKRHQEQEALFCIRRPAEEFPFDFREVVPELALGDYSVELVLAFCVPDACGSKYYTGKSYPPNLPLEAEITNGLWRCSAIVTWAGGGELRAEYTLGVQPGQPIEIAEQSQHFEERKAAHGDGGDVIVLEQFVKRLQDQDAKIASAAGAIPPRVLGELIRLFEEINRSCPSLLEPFEGHGNAVVLRSQISTAVGKVSARIDDLKLGRPI